MHKNALKLSHLGDMHISYVKITARVEQYRMGKTERMKRAAIHAVFESCMLGVARALLYQSEYV